ncbi:MAG: ATP-binding protein [Anaerolineales bacterium]|nr:tetratricopeptide repeat protein [Anaerolineales bacterium]NUQ84405.1 ATP-binding protein [Anaerolineales bacterium]
MTSPYTERYTGLWATPELVGRQDILEKFGRILRDPSPAPRLVFLHGVGGIGKTRLLQKVLEMARNIENCRVAEELMDFYHIGLHTPIGLANAIFEILTPPFDSFQVYQSAYQALNRARLSGDVVELEKQREDAIKKFEQDFRQLSAKQRIVLALDTAERVVYGLPGWSDEIPLAESWNWLIEHLPTWENVVIFTAGREEAKPAVEGMKAQKSVAVEEIEVGSFNPDESLQYFDEVAKLLEKEKDYQLAERLKNFPLDEKKRAHDYSQGRPILLSLLVDYLSFPGEGDVEAMLREVPPERLSEEDRRRYEEALLNRLREGELGETLLALGRVPKGADEEMLAALLNIPHAEARQRLKDVRKLSVVKIRPEDQRVFLHDEMYALLQRHVYDYGYDAETQKTAFEAIKKYYQIQRRRITQRLNELYAPVEEKGRESLNMEELGKVHTQYQTLLAETMYYYLRYDLGRGFRAYYRFSHEAIMARDLQMDLQLQAELLSYLSRPPAPILEKDISIELILASLKVRPIARDWARSAYEHGLTEGDKFIETIEKKWRSKFPVLFALAQVWTASLHIMRGAGNDYSEAESHLQEAYSLLLDEEVNQPFADLLFPDTMLWLKKAAAALAHRVHGYLKRVQGFMKDAVDEYQKAAVLLREIDLRKEMATVMNDMGFAQGEMGEWHDARSNVRDALRLGRELGPRVPVALSLNTLAAIQVHEGQYGDARENSQQALAIFRAFSYKRGIGMALVTLAEASRRYAGMIPPLIPEEERIDLLRRARDYAREASALFTESGEKPRQVEALIEIGCACRDWVWRLKQNPQGGDDPKRLRRESEDALNKAAELAKEARLIYRYVDARVNLAWLEFYMLEVDEEVTDAHAIWKAIQSAEDAFPPDAEMEKQPQVWAQKGKLLALRGHLAFRQFLLKRDHEKKTTQRISKQISSEVQSLLERAAENYALALDYNSRFAADYQGFRQAKDGISDRLKQLNAAEMRVICHKIQKLYPQGSVIQTFLINRALWQTT